MIVRSELSHTCGGFQKTRRSYLGCRPRFLKKLEEFEAEQVQNI
jgi:hypothetical protein